jgi:hypothetical protein
MLAMAACAPKPLKTSTPFDIDEVAWSRKDGTNTVNGFAVLRTVGGEARTCAGLEVGLVPDSLHARDRMSQLYGSLEKGYRIARQTPKFETDDRGYVMTARRTRCDGQGQFSFEKVPDGSWYLVSQIVWMPAPSSGIVEGANMMKSVDVKGGQTVKVSLP